MPTSSYSSSSDISSFLATFQTLTAYLFLKSWHRQHLGYTWLAKHIDDKNEQRKHVLAVVFMLPLWTPWRYRDQVMDIVHAFLIPAKYVLPVR
jgi:hypothetical protein